MVKDTIYALTIQRDLNNGPKNPFGEPIFKLVWSEDCLEQRIGTYRVYSDNIFIREETKLDTVLKYNFLKDRWIFEQWFSPEVAYNPELPNSVKGSYEAVYVFEDGRGNALPLNLTVIQFLIKECMKPKTSDLFKKTLSKNLKEEKQKIAYNQDMEMLQDEGPLVSQFHDGSAILLPGKDF